MQINHPILVLHNDDLNSFSSILPITLRLLSMRLSESAQSYKRK